MNKIEFAKLADWIKTCYPREALFPNKASMSIWYEELKDIDFDTALSAVRKHVQTSKWSPTISDIRTLASGIKNDAVCEWSDGWKQVIKAISTYGYNREREALQAMDEVTREAVKRLGWMSLCMSDNAVADRANFRQVYEQISAREKLNKVMSDSLLSHIEETRKALSVGLLEKGKQDEQEEKNTEKR